MAKVKKTYYERLDEMSFEELQKLADAAIEKYRKDEEMFGKNSWMPTAKKDSINALHKKVRQFYIRMADKNKEFDCKAAMDKLPHYKTEKVSDDAKIKSYINVEFVAEHRDSFIGNLFQQEHVYE